MNERFVYPPVSDPSATLPPILEPGFVERMELSPFKPSTREYWMEVAKWECQYEYYDERKQTWRTCGARADHVHHIIPEGWELEHGNDPEHGTGLPLCDRHHVRNSGSDIGTEGASFHPDVSQDYSHYGEWKEQQRHMKNISGRRSIDYSTSPFAETAHEHHDMAQKGERYWGGDGRSDEYYIQKMQNMAAHSGIKKPQTEPHPRTDTSKKTHWWDNTFDDKPQSGGTVTTETFKPKWFGRRRR